MWFHWIICFEFQVVASIIPIRRKARFPNRKERAFMHSQHRVEKAPMGVLGNLFYPFWRLGP